MLFDRLWESFGKNVLRYANSHCPRDLERCEANQLAYIAVWRASMVMEEKEIEPLPYIFRIIKNEYNTFYRCGILYGTNSIKREYVDIDDEDIHYCPSVPDTCMGSVFASQMKEALALSLTKIHHKYADVWRLYNLNDFSLKEVMASLNIPLGTVKSRLSRARLELQQHMGVYYYELREY